MARAMAALNSLPLPEELLEQVFFRLPYAILLRARQVCRKWRRILHSAHFRASYRGMAKLVQTRTGNVLDLEVFDGDGNVVPVPNLVDLSLAKLSCRKTGLLCFWDKADQIFIVGNLFSNKWAEVPGPPVSSPDCDRVALFSLGDGPYKLAYWECSGELYTRESGEQEWTTEWSPTLDCERYWAGLAMKGTSLFRLDHHSDKLVEYRILGDGKLTKVCLTSTSKEQLELSIADERELLTWENRLYLLLMFYLDDDSAQRMELWVISTTDGAATLVVKHEIEGWYAGLIHHAEIEDGRLVVLYQEPQDCRELGAMTLTCNMESKKVESMCARATHLYWKSITVPVMLSQKVDGALPSAVTSCHEEESDEAAFNADPRAA